MACALAAPVLISIHHWTTATWGGGGGGGKPCTCWVYKPREWEPDWVVYKNWGNSTLAAGTGWHIKLFTLGLPSITRGTRPLPKISPQNRQSLLLLHGVQSSQGWCCGWHLPACLFWGAWKLWQNLGQCGEDPREALESFCLHPESVTHLAKAHPPPPPFLTHLMMHIPTPESTGWFGAMSNEWTAMGTTNCYILCSDLVLFVCFLVIGVASHVSWHGDFP